MLDEAIACELQFAEDLLGGGIAGLSVSDMQRYLEYCADQRLLTLGFANRSSTRPSELQRGLRKTATRLSHGCFLNPRQ
jgi:ribonucleotide reductase beta subunit family protein with ferritin-like domain